MVDRIYTVNVLNSTRWKLVERCFQHVAILERVSSSLLFQHVERMLLVRDN